MKAIRALAVSLLLGAAMLLPAQRADAHAVYSTWGNVSSTPFFMFHTSPDRSAWTYVGYDAGGFWTGTTTVVSATAATYYLRAYDRCTSGWSAPTTGWVWVPGADYHVRGSAYCTVSALSQGRCGISH